MPPAEPTPRVLIAEDDPQSAELLEAYLSGTGYEVKTAADGQETLVKRTRDGIPIAPALMRGLDQVATDLGIAKLT